MSSPDRSRHRMLHAKEAEGDDEAPQKRRPRAEEPTEEELAALRSVDQPTLRPFVPESYQGKRIGRTNFDTQVFQACKSLLRHEEISIHYTKALVLDAASGTGKTFSVLSLPTVANSSSAVDNTKFLLAYIGLNIEWYLTDCEMRELNSVRIENDEIATRSAVESVLLPRLLGVLQQLINQHAELGRYTVPDGAFPLVHFNVPNGDLRNAALRKVVIEKAKELHGCFPGQNLVLVTNLDSAHHLDRYGGTGATRAGLMLLRELQFSIFSRDVREENRSTHKCLLLPIATGVKPDTIPVSDNEGRNMPITAELLTLDEFTQLAEDRYKDKPRMLVKQLAAATYPRVFDMMRQLEPIAVPDLDAEVAGELVACAHSRKLMAREEIPAHIYAVGTQDLAVPILDLAVWPTLQYVLKISAIPYFPSMDLMRESDARQRFAEFESHAFRVIGFTLELLNSHSKHFDDFKRAFMEDNDPFICAWGKKSMCKSTFRILREGLKLHPFLHDDSPEQAAKGKFSSEFLYHLNDLRDECYYRSVFLWAGGSAPFDFINVQMVDRSSKTVAIALGNAKHFSDLNEKTEDNVEREALALGEKAVWWIAGMKRELTHLGYTVEDACPVSLITNVPTPSFKTESVQYKEVAEDGAETVVEVIVLSPSNFRFSPWTDLLFRSEFQRNDDDEIEDFRKGW